MKLSIAIAAHNEEKNIIRCLESVYDWVDEVAIVDGTSTDKTVTMVKNFDRENKIRVYAEKNEAMFHKNKQKAIERCRGAWILQLDADEVVTPELRDEIKNICLLPLNDIDPIAYWIPRLNYFLGRPLRKGGQYPDYTIRFYKNGTMKFPCKSVHEQVEIATLSAHNETSLSIKNSKIGHLKSDLLHFPYPTFSDYLEKWQRYSFLEAKFMYDRGVRPSLSNLIKYAIIYPKWWFLKTYFRHLGLTDGFPGFVFSLFSAMRYVLAYCFLYEIAKK